MARNPDGILFPDSGERSTFRVDAGRIDDLGDDFYRYEEILLFERDYFILTDGLVWCRKPRCRALDPLLFLDLVVDRSVGKKLVLNHKNIKSWRNAKEVSK